MDPGDPYVCPACSCMCDDLLVRSGPDGPVSDQACARGAADLAARSTEEGPECEVSGRSAVTAVGVARIVERLRASRYPMIYGLRDLSTDAQRIALALADRIGAVVDTTTSSGHAPSILAVQNVGKVSCTLGEVRHRGDLVVYWGCDPASNQPRLLQRCGKRSVGRFLPEGRTVAVVDPARTETAAQADLHFPLRPGSDFEALWTLRALLMGQPVDPGRALIQTGIEIDRWKDLVERMRTSRFGVILFGMGLMQSRGWHQNAAAAHSLARDLNRHTAFVCRAVTRPGNVLGADNVLCWTTGFSFAVNLARGFPRYGPGEYTLAEALDRREPDLLLLLGADLPELSASAREHLGSIPVLRIGSDPTPLPGAEVDLRVADYATTGTGTLYRLDEVPLPIRPVRASGRSSAESILQWLLQSLER